MRREFLKTRTDLGDGFQMKVRWVILVGLWGSFGALGCSRIELLVAPILSPLMKKQVVIVCADKKIDNALEFHEKAKVELANHFEDHESDRLLVAYYAAEDSINEVKASKKCFDRQPRHFYATKNLLELNRSLQQVIRINMRENDPQDLIAIYRDQYHKVIPNDIQ